MESEQKERHNADTGISFQRVGNPQARRFMTDSNVLHMSLPLLPVPETVLNASCPIAKRQKLFFNERQKYFLNELFILLCIERFQKQVKN